MGRLPRAGRPSAKERAIEAVRSGMSTEEQRLQTLEEIINQNLSAFYDVGCALKEIRDNQLYKLQGYSNFEDYCQEKWDMGRTYAHRLEVAVNVIDNLKMLPIGNKILPVNESQVRPLTRLLPEEQRQAWEKVIETAPVIEDKPKVTAKLVEEVVSQVTGQVPKEKKSKDEKVTYKVSVEVDDALNEVFYRVRQLAGKERKKISKEAMVEVLLQMALKESGEKEEIVMEKVLKNTKEI